MTLVEEFVSACAAGDVNDAKSLLEKNPGLLNKVLSGIGETGLMVALLRRRHSLSRWLLSLPGLDTSVRDDDNMTALHHFCMRYDPPLDILITLARLSSWETVNIMDCNGDTALDWTGQSSAPLYLSWLGARCMEQNRFSEWEYGSKAIKFWGNHASTQEKLCWAIAANMR